MFRDFSAVLIDRQLCSPKLPTMRVGWFREVTTSVCGCLVLLLSASVAVAGEAPSDRPALKAKYQRPGEIPFPEGNPYSEAKSKLGRILFFDPLLSGSRLRSCATCHNPSLSWADGLPLAVGEKQMPLRSPTLLNVAWVPRPGWTGHFSSLEAVAFGPITSPGNMDLPEKELIRRLSEIPGYVKRLPRCVWRQQDHAPEYRTRACNLPTLDRLGRSPIRPLDQGQ